MSGAPQRHPLGLCTLSLWMNLARLGHSVMKMHQVTTGPSVGEWDSMMTVMLLHCATNTRIRVAKELVRLYDFSEFKIIPGLLPILLI